jgi:hypothetical protein
VAESGHTYNFRVTARDFKIKRLNVEPPAPRGFFERGFKRYLYSVSLATDADGDLLSQARYSPYGQVRWSGETVMPTNNSFTGQQSDGSLSGYLPAPRGRQPERRPAPRGCQPERGPAPRGRQPERGPAPRGCQPERGPVPCFLRSISSVALWSPSCTSLNLTITFLILSLYE